MRANGTIWWRRARGNDSLRLLGGGWITLAGMFEATKIDGCPWILAGVLLVVSGMSPSLALDSGPDRALAPQKAPAAQSVAAHTPAVTPPLPEGQVWQCLAAGQRIFSDSPCGAGASIRQLNPVNRMASTRVPPTGYYRYVPPMPGYGAGQPELFEPVDDGYETDLVYVHGAVHRTGHRSDHRQPNHAHRASR
jgi:hypothetical protein